MSRGHTQKVLASLKLRTVLDISRDPDEWTAADRNHIGIMLDNICVERCPTSDQVTLYIDYDKPDVEKDLANALEAALTWRARHPDRES